jgi:hypothetical protein
MTDGPNTHNPNMWSGGAERGWWGAAMAPVGELVGGCTDKVGQHRGGGREKRETEMQAVVVGMTRATCQARPPTARCQVGGERNRVTSTLANAAEARG